MYHVICCNGYYTVASTNVRKDAMRICMTHKDGDFVNIIRQDGREIGNSVDGWIKKADKYCPDAATQTGMYDRD